MEFDGQYLTYEEYKALGGDLDLLPFNLLEFEARKAIDKRTQNRLKNIEEIPEEVKLCEYKMINKLNSYNKALDNISGVSSENIDGYSVSYTNSSEVLTNKTSEMEGIMEDYLMNVVVNGTHIMYLGVK